MNWHISNTNTIRNHSGNLLKRPCRNIKIKFLYFIHLPHPKEFPIDIYLLLFLLIVLIGSVTVYIFYLKEKKEELDAIRRGFCPKCHQDTIILTDQRSGGCSGPKIITYECDSCGYHNSFSVENSGGCGSGGCQ